MTLLYPWGLLGLLSLPVILGLHFFRQQRQHRRVGGLHLWDFARVATPAGRRFERLHRSLPLLFQLLAALLLTLLLAGLDWPRQSTGQSYVVVLDDSISMQATSSGKSSAERAQDALAKWAPAADSYTLILAGRVPTVLVGPGATRAQFLDALSRWKPESNAADFQRAINVAQKFATSAMRVLLVTDAPNQAGQVVFSAEAANSPASSSSVSDDGKSTAPSAAPRIIPWGVGSPANNNAIIFADRFRPEPGSERVIATVQRFGQPGKPARLEAFLGDTMLGSQEVNLATTKPVTVQLNFKAINQPIRLQLSPKDALAADNEAVLLPGLQKTVTAWVDPALPHRESFIRAIQAVPGCELTENPAAADVVLTVDRPGSAANFGGTAGATESSEPSSAERYPRANRIYRFTADAASSQSLRIAEGRDLVFGEESRLAQNLSMEGVLWPFLSSTAPSPSLALSADIAYTSIPLLFQEQSATRNQATYKANLVLASTNIFRHPAWPVLMMNIMNDSRENLPGISRSNLRSGENLLLNLPAAADRLSSRSASADGTPLTLWHEGDSKPAQTWTETAPTVLSGLRTGHWVIRRGGSEKSPVAAEFMVNLFSSTESDLQPMSSQQPDFSELRADGSQQTRQNFLIFYALLAALCCCVILAWKYEDAGH